jgi:ubiquinone/menaquinone biosynthesis C-methylase UbiE
MRELYKEKYSKNLPKVKDIFVDRTFLFQKTLKELKPTPKDKVLEIGCDKGIFVNFLKDKCDIRGIDINRDAVLSSNSDRISLMDATKTDFKKEEFDKIYSFHTIEHIPNLFKFFKEVDRILKKGGLVVLGYPFEPIRGIFTIRTAWRLKVNPRKLHLHSLTPNRLKKYLRGTSLRIVKSRLYFALIPQYLTVLKKM